MGQDANQKILADYNDVFADIMNVLLFDGKKVVNEEGLENSKDRSQYKADGKLHEQERDVSKFYREQELRIAFLGIEHQNEKDYCMPARVISYDGSCYRAQLLERKNRSGITAGDEKRLKKRRKLYPVVTLVLYFGTSHWNQGKSLYEILDMPEDFKPFVNDYKINMVEVAYLSEEQIQKFQSDFRIVAEYFSQKRQYGKYEPKRIEIKHVDEILKLLGVMARDDRFPEVIEAMNEEKEKKGRVTMCEVLDEIENRGIQKGIQKGIRKGIQQERVHTEEQRLRAEEAEARAKAAEAEVERLRKLLASQG